MIAKKLFERILYFSLPNTLLKKEIFPEFLQEKATPKNISNAAHTLLNRIDSSDKTFINDLNTLSRHLGPENCFENVSWEILSLLDDSGNT